MMFFYISCQYFYLQMHLTLKRYSLHLNGFLVSPFSGQAVLILLHLNFSDCIFILKILVA